jgi:hypothetical protein
MNPMVKGAVALLLRQAVILLAAWLGLSGELEPYMGELTAWSASAAVVVITVVMAIRSKFRERQKLVTALNAAAMSEHQAAAMIKDPYIETPSVTSAKNTIPLA